MDDLVTYAMNHLGPTCLEVNYTSLSGKQLSIWLGNTVLFNVMPEKVVGFSSYDGHRLINYRSAASIKQTIRRLERQYRVRENYLDSEA